MLCLTTTTSLLPLSAFSLPSIVSPLRCDGFITLLRRSGLTGDPQRNRLAHFELQDTQVYSPKMATAIPSKPSAPHQTKMKRPPLPAVQTNGIQSSQSSPSPLLSSKRPPSGFKAPPTPTVNANTNTNGVQPRLSQRRKDSQKPSELSRTRGGKDGERRVQKASKPEPYGTLFS